VPTHPTSQRADRVRHADLGEPDPRQAARELLVADFAASERDLEPAGVPTRLLEAGDGPPLLLLHGPGESGVKWAELVPRLAVSYRVLAPDLPAHGDGAPYEGPLDIEAVLAWMDELIDMTCESPPAVVGHIVGGAIAARYAAARSSRLDRLVLVDSLGLGRFWPAPRFALTMLSFRVRPSARTYERFMRQCSYDIDGVRERMGDLWEPFVSYNVSRARSPVAGASGRLMKAVGMRRIPLGELAKISVPTALIWGRHDRANRLRIAETASRTLGWPLYVIDGCADDPALDRPDAFLEALDRALAAHGAVRPTRLDAPSGGLP
jgi:pimeloyl-ACP methyl ester carboxylesterase